MMRQRNKFGNIFYYELKVTGIDISESMIKLAEINYPEGKFFVDDIRTFNTDSKIDAVAAAFCIDHLEQEYFFKNFLLLCIENHIFTQALWKVNTEDFEKTSFTDKPIYFNYYTTDLIKKELEENGFYALEINSEDWMDL